jgi:hypothetical protein
MVWASAYSYKKVFFLLMPSVKKLWTLYRVLQICVYIFLKTWKDNFWLRRHFWPTRGLCKGLGATSKKPSRARPVSCEMKVGAQTHTHFLIWRFMNYFSVLKLLSHHFVTWHKPAKSLHHNQNVIQFSLTID